MLQTVRGAHPATRAWHLLKAQFREGKLTVWLAFATVNDWSAICWTDGAFFEAAPRRDLEILDRIGGGDSFASGLMYGFLTGRDPQWAVDCGAAHGALAMTTPGDTSMATLSEVERVMKGGTARVAR